MRWRQRLESFKESSVLTDDHQVAVHEEERIHGDICRACCCFFCGSPAGEPVDGGFDWPCKSPRDLRFVEAFQDSTPKARDILDVRIRSKKKLKTTTQGSLR